MSVTGAPAPFSSAALIQHDAYLRTCGFPANTARAHALAVFSEAAVAINDTSIDAEKVERDVLSACIRSAALADYPHAVLRRELALRAGDFSEHSASAADEESAVDVAALARRHEAVIVATVDDRARAAAAVCSRCKGTDFRTTQLQTCAGDEGMTVWITCRKCGKTEKHGK
jgi:DNA-directed RNA polymerase subunit M/transcription elongation factor TFIIS